ncbi:hypothetical protein OY671_008348, partial [Metschnikowia pulcherrima]
SAEESQSRAAEALERLEAGFRQERRASGVEDASAESPHSTEAMSVTSGKAGIKTSDDSADSATDESIARKRAEQRRRDNTRRDRSERSEDKGGVSGEYGSSEEQGNEIIMAARAHWRPSMRNPHNEPLVAERQKTRTAGEASPERRCVLTGRHDDRDASIRLASSPMGDVAPDPLARAPGRGAWIGVSRAESAQASAGDYRIICPDTIGRGSSQWSPDPVAEYQSDFYARSARASLDGSGSDRVRWVGTSMGGATGMYAAAPTLKDRIKPSVVH